MISMFDCFVHFIRCPQLLLLLLTLGCESFSCNIIVGSRFVPFCCCCICSSFLNRLADKSCVQIDSQEDFDFFFRSALKCSPSSKSNIISIIIVIFVVIIIIIVVGIIIIIITVIITFILIMNLVF